MTTKRFAVTWRCARCRQTFSTIESGEFKSFVVAEIKPRLHSCPRQQYEQDYSLQGIAHAASIRDVV